MRVRMQLDPQLQRNSRFKDVQKFWWQPPSSKQSIDKLLVEVGEHLGLDPQVAALLSAELDGFQVLPGTSVSLLREGDLLQLKLSRPKRTAPQAAAAEHPAKRAKAQKNKAAVDVRETQLPEDSPSDGDSSSEKSSSQSSSSSDDEQGSAGAELERFYTPAAKLGVPENGALPATKQVEPPGTEKPRPSRSARRKAAKRRLRREGVLPPAPNKKQQQREKGRQAGDHAWGEAPAAAAAIPTATMQREGAQHAGVPGNINMRKLATKAGKGRAVRAGDRQGGTLHAKIYFDDEQDGSSGKTSNSSSSSDDDADEPPPQQQQQGQEGKVRAAALSLRGAARGRQHQGQRREVPEVTVSPRHLQGHRQPQERAGTSSEAPQPRTMLAVPTEEHLGGLEVVNYLPAAGSVLAYKLLEMGPNFAPQVSEVRLGRVTGFNPDDSAVVLEPYPDPGTHPLTWQRAAARAARAARAGAYGEEYGDDEDEEEEEEEDPGAYQEDGTLHTQLSSFVELRMLRGGRADPPPQPAQQGATLSPPFPPRLTEGPPEGEGAQGEDGVGGEAGAGVEQLGPLRYSQLGPPCGSGGAGRGTQAGAAMGGAVIPPIGGWASLHQQLQRRRAELAQQQQQPAAVGAGGAEALPTEVEVPTKGGAPGQGVPAPASPAVQGAGGAEGPNNRGPSQPRGRKGEAQLSLQSPTGGGSTGRDGNGSCGGRGGKGLPAAKKKVQGLTPGVTKPRGGVRASAMGPLLRMLRGANELDESRG